MLTETEISEFFEIGWISRPAVFRRDEVARMRACFERLEAMAAEMTESGLNQGSQFVLGEKDGQQVVKRVVWAGGSQPYLLEIGEDERLTKPSSQLLGSANIEQLLSQAHYKRPGDGVVFGWHQDIQHRDKGNGTWADVNGRGSFVQTLIVIDDMTTESGPVQFMPGSSKWGRVDFGNHDYDNTDYRLKFPAQFDEDNAVIVTARPGDVIFFGPYTAHASFENKTNQYRRVFINGYAYPGANAKEYPGVGSCRTITVD